MSSETAKHPTKRKTVAGFAPYRYQTARSAVQRLQVYEAISLMDATSAGISGKVVKRTHTHPQTNANPVSLRTPLQSHTAGVASPKYRSSRQGTTDEVQELKSEGVKTTRNLHFSLRLTPM